MIDPKCKNCRAVGEKLFIKGDRCYGPKCAMVKRPTPPGIHGKKRRRTASEYGKQLSEKQHVKEIYGIRERQFKKYVKEAMAKKGDNREILARNLEMRLDNVVYRLGWTKSRNAARQLVGHGHVLVNKKRVTIPSYRVKKGQELALSEKIKKSTLTAELPNILKKYEPPVWLASQKERPEAKIMGEPQADDLGNLAPVGLIIEFYSR